ncbi:MAG TPA: serine protease [Herpetosiphonaceae bacterium]
MKHLVRPAWLVQFRRTLGIIAFLMALIGFPFHAAAQPPDPSSNHPTPPSSDRPGTEIVGGTEAVPGAWPWTAELRLNGGHWCGGSLIAPRWIVTAAHCVYGKSAIQFTVVLGEHDLNAEEGTEQRFSVSQIKIHPNYNDSTKSSDIALLNLSSDAVYTSRVQPVTLLQSPFDNPRFAPGVVATVVGWGRTSEGGASASRLLQVSVPIVSNSTCNQSQSYNGRVDSTMLCAGYSAGGKDSCQGDSGGPLVVPYGSTWGLAGIVSWGDGCARAYKYGVYTRFGIFTDWVQREAGIPTPPPTAWLSCEGTGFGGLYTCSGMGSEGLQPYTPYWQLNSGSWTASSSGSGPFSYSVRCYSSCTVRFKVVDSLGRTSTNIASAYVGP